MLKHFYDQRVATELAGFNKERSQGGGQIFGRIKQVAGSSYLPHIMMRSVSSL